MKICKLTILLLLLFAYCMPGNKEKPVSPIANSANFLIGTWQNIHSSSPDFKLDGDSVIYLQENPGIKYKYDFNADSLIFHFPKFDYAFRLYSFAGDSIHLDSEMNSNTFKKVKE